MGDFARDVLKAIEGHTENEPQDLPGILDVVDWKRRVILTHDELVDTLRRLIEAGKIAETRFHRYYIPAEPPAERLFSGVSRSQYEDALDTYLSAVAKASQEANDADADWEGGTDTVVVRWKQPGIARPGDEGVEAVQDLADRLADALSEMGMGYVSGILIGQDYVDIEIFTETPGERADDIYHGIAPVFRGYGCPPGSCIVRRYAHGPERTSDVV